MMLKKGKDADNTIATARIAKNYHTDIHGMYCIRVKHIIFAATACSLLGCNLIFATSGEKTDASAPLDAAVDAVACRPKTFECALVADTSMDADSVQTHDTADALRFRNTQSSAALLRFQLPTDVPAASNGLVVTSLVLTLPAAINATACNSVTDSCESCTSVDVAQLWEVSYLRSDWGLGVQWNNPIWSTAGGLATTDRQVISSTVRHSPGSATMLTVDPSLAALAVGWIRTSQISFRVGSSTADPGIVAAKNNFCSPSVSTGATLSITYCQ
jgi:hypothetical protein